MLDLDRKQERGGWGVTHGSQHQTNLKESASIDFYEIKYNLQWFCKQDWARPNSTRYNSIRKWQHCSPICANIFWTIWNNSFSTPAKKVFKLVRKSMALFVKRLGYTSKGSPVEIMVKCNNKDQWHAIKNKHQIAVFCDQLLRRVNWQHNFSISSSARLRRNHEKNEIAHLYIANMPQILRIVEIANGTTHTRWLMVAEGY